MDKPVSEIDYTEVQSQHLQNDAGLAEKIANSTSANLLVSSLTVRPNSDHPSNLNRRSNVRQFNCPDQVR